MSFNILIPTKFQIWTGISCFLAFISCNTLQNPNYHSRRIQGETSLYYNYDLNFKLNLGFDFKIRNEDIVRGRMIRPLQSNLYSFELVNLLLNRIVQKDWREINPIFQAQKISGPFVKVLGIAYNSREGQINKKFHEDIIHFLSHYRETETIKSDSTIILDSLAEKNHIQKAYKYFTLFSFKQKSFGLIDYFLPYQGKLLRFMFCACLTDGFYDDYEIERFKLPNHGGNIRRSKLEILEDQYASEIMSSFGPVYDKKQPQQNEDFFNIAYQGLKSGTYPNFLQSLIDLRLSKPKVDTIINSYYNQAFQTYQCIAGSYDSLKIIPKSIDSVNEIETKNWDQSMMGFSKNSAKNYILNHVLDKQVVMFNESHVNYQHRRFEESLLENFYKAGFRYLAIEALSYEDQFINQRKIPLVNSGYYCKEPAFGNYIRKALKLGFTLVPYEDTTDCDYSKMNCNFRRDSLMALNISKILKINPAAKILVHAGYEHIDKKSSPNRYPMAMKFKDITGIDPFCINQTLLSENGVGSRTDLVQFLKQKFNPEFPTVFTNLKSETWIDSSIKGRADLFIYHPFNPYLFEKDSTQSYSQKLNLSFPPLYGSHQELMVQVYILSEYNQFKNLAQPVFQKNFMDRFEPFSIFLPADDYLLVYRDQDGNRVGASVQNL